MPRCRFKCGGRNTSVKVSEEEEPEDTFQVIQQGVSQQATSSENMIPFTKLMPAGSAQHFAHHPPAVLATGLHTNCRQAANDMGARTSSRTGSEDLPRHSGHACRASTASLHSSRSVWTSRPTPCPLPTETSVRCRAVANRLVYCHALPRLWVQGRHCMGILSDAKFSAAAATPNDARKLHFSAS